MASGARLLRASRGDDWIVHRDGNRAGLWFVAPDRTSTGNLAVVSNPVFISSGLWSWSNRFGQDDWFWHNRNHDGIWFWHQPQPERRLVPAQHHQRR